MLTDTGHTDVAYRLLTQRTFPSWGYQIDRGATTMWERWDSIRPDGSFQDAGMNSFNHYAYGSVGEWMYANIAGIAPGAPGFRKILVRPRPGGGVTRAEGRFDSRYGPVATRWRKDADGFALSVVLPPNTTAEVWVPGGDERSAGRGAADFLRLDDGCAVFSAGRARTGSRPPAEQSGCPVGRTVPRGTPGATRGPSRVPGRAWLPDATRSTATPRGGRTRPSPVGRRGPGEDLSGHRAERDGLVRTVDQEPVRVGAVGPHGQLDPPARRRRAAR